MVNPAPRKCVFDHDVRDMMTETIVALATAPGRSGVAVVRVSGSLVRHCIATLWSVSAPTPRQMNYGALTDAQGHLIDQGLWVYFAAPASFTGEDVLEFHGHGNPLLIDQVVARFCTLGCRLAEPGEFSKRAFLNDKMDLVQAEAVADLIAAHSKHAIDMAFQSLQGVFSERIEALVANLITLRVYLEASLDFTDEDIDFLAEGDVEARVADLLQQLQAIQAAATQGVLLQEGVQMVVVGPPNAGKSSLFNALLGREEAIVTQQAGTTRDLLTQSLRLGDLVVTMTDTAGIRETDDCVEQAGIQRAKTRLASADLVVVMLATEHLDVMNHQDFMTSLSLPQRAQVVQVINKIDQWPKQKTPQLPEGVLCLSTRHGEGLDTLVATLQAHAKGMTQSEGCAFLARRRHLEALKVATTALQQGKAALLAHRAGELLAEECRVAQDALGQITGTYTHDDLLTDIFSTFCIGK